MKFEPLSQQLIAALSVCRPPHGIRPVGAPADSLQPLRRPGEPPPARPRPAASLPHRGTSLLTPSLSYGRHRGPAPSTARQAAVAIVWLRRPDGSWQLPLTLRSQRLRHHGGQVSFPGGTLEPGETPAQGALREFQEELGVAPVDPLMCGELHPLYVYASNHLVFPIVFTAAAPDAPWAPNRQEVQQVLEMPLASLFRPALSSQSIRWRPVTRDRRPVGGFQFRSTAYRLQGRLVWGATAMLLAQLADLLREPLTAPASEATTD